MQLRTLAFIAALAAVAAQGGCNEEAGFTYDASTGVCLFALTPVMCNDGFVMDDTTAQCVPLLMELRCEEGYLYDGEVGACVPELQPLECADGFVLDPVRATCVPLLQPIICRAGTILDAATGMCKAPVVLAPTPSATASASAAATRSAAPTSSASNSAAATATASRSADATASATGSATASASQSVPAAAGSGEAMPSASSTRLPRPSVSSTPTPSASQGAPASTTPSPTPSPSAKPEEPVLTLSLLFTPPAGIELGTDSFTARVQSAVARAMAASLGVNESAVTVVGVEPVYQARRRQLPVVEEAVSVQRPALLRALQAQARTIIGYRLILALQADEAARSTVLTAAAGGGSLTDLSVLAAATASVTTRITSDSTLANALVAVDPTVITGLGYSSVAEMTAGVGMDPSRPVAVAGAPATPSPAPSSTSNNAAVAGIVVGVIVVIALAAYAGLTLKGKGPGQAASSGMEGGKGHGKDFDGVAVVTTTPAHPAALPMPSSTIASLDVTEGVNPMVANRKAFSTRHVEGQGVAAPSTASTAATDSEVSADTEYAAAVTAPGPTAPERTHV